MRYCEFFGAADSVRRSALILLSILSLGLFGGCSYLGLTPSGPTAEELNATIDAQKSEIEILKSDKADLQSQLSSLRGEREQLEAENKALNERLGELEQAVFTGERVKLFGGDIDYGVKEDAIEKYRMGLRFKALYDDAFAAELNQFREKRGGDTAMFGVLRDIDVSGDRIIDLLEATNFARAMEEQFAASQASGGS